MSPQRMTLEHTNTIQDYISGAYVQATPEEIHTVQPYSKKLVHEYGYPKSHIAPTRNLR